MSLSPPTLAGRFFTTESAGKSMIINICKQRHCKKCKGMKKLGIYIWTCKNENDDEAEFMASFDVFICSNSFLKEKKNTIESLLCIK